MKLHSIFIHISMTCFSQLNKILIILPMQLLSLTLKYSLETLWYWYKKKLSSLRMIQLSFPLLNLFELTQITKRERQLLIWNLTTDQYLKLSCFHWIDLTHKVKATEEILPLPAAPGYRLSRPSPAPTVARNVPLMFHPLPGNGNWALSQQHFLLRGLTQALWAGSAARQGGMRNSQGAAAQAQGTEDRTAPGKEQETEQECFNPSGKMDQSNDVKSLERAHEGCRTELLPFPGTARAIPSRKDRECTRPCSVREKMKAGLWFPQISLLQLWNRTNSALDCNVKRSTDYWVTWWVKQRQTLRNYRRRRKKEQHHAKLASCS